ncbi:MAG TPA: branched-chain amino acid ABC transporter substrate-binding protein [Gaiellaceae bacterium]|nr:branched-chain amino acid ABC transporter substrate-binding protein [Gaiellaceae bacterium]
MKKGIIFALTVVMIASAAAASIAVANPNGSTAVAAGPSCKVATIALTGPYTGPAASAGIDQRNWGRLFIQYWNSGKAIPGTPSGFHRTKLRAIEADTALNPQLAATVAVQLRSNKAMLAVNGFSGSQENVAGGPILRRGHLAFVSGSATRASLTDPVTPDGHVLKKFNSAGKALAPVYFRRVVPTDKRQGLTDATFVMNKLGVKSGDQVMTVDQAEAYSVPLTTLITQTLQKAGVKVDRQSQPAAETDFTALANRAVAERAKAVVFASQVASNAQLFLQQLKSKGFSGQFLGTDGTFDSSKFTVPGAYISSFSLDIHDVPIAKPIVANFEKQYGKTISFGAPSWVAVQTIAMGISTACADGQVSRGEVRRDIGQVKLKTSLLGKPIAFDKFGDVVGGVGFTIFKIGSGGSYDVVQKG